MNIQEKDLEVIEAMAKSYGISMVELGKAIVNQTKKRADRQFRVSDQEFEVISEKAKEKGLTVMRYCEYACSVFVSRKKLDGEFFGNKRYGEGRTKRITVQFKDAKVESELLNFADSYNVEIGALIRYCALTI